MLGCCRGVYSLSARGEGISPKVFSQIDKETNMPHNSSAFALLACAVWFVYFILMGLGVFDLGVISKYAFDSSELPIITIYPMYVPILIVMMVKEKDVHPFKRFVLPILSIVGIGIIVAASILKHGMANVWYLIVFAAVMLIGWFVLKHNEKNKNAEKQ
jgi:APA family basic amino acid/polyamine antiporter